MSTELKITQVGNSLGIILPKEIIASLNVKKGDKLYVNSVKDGIQIRQYDAEFARQMAIAEEIMHEDRDVLRKLAE